MASLYKHMGIENHAFILALHDPSLEFVDPHSPNLTEMEKFAIARECKINPWYFFREVARAPGIGSPEPTPVEANRGNIALWWSFFNHITIILIQIRQTGKSFSTDVLMTYLLNVICESTQINLITKDDTLRKANIERMKSIRDDLPPYLNMRTKADSDNTEEITVKRLSNVYKTHVPQQSPKGAYKLGRGLTSGIMQFDEAPFQPNIKISLPSALAATGAAVEKARAVGAPYGTIITTTAGKKDDADGKYVYDLVSCAATWNEKAFFDCKNEEELVKIVKANSKPAEGEREVTRAVVNATFNHRQLGKSDDWLRDRIARAMVTQDDANRDFFNMWTSGSLTNPIPINLLDRMRANQSDVVYSQIDTKHGYITKWYIPENRIEDVMRNRKFVMSLDTSDAVGRDAIALVLTDTETFTTVAAGMYNETNVIHFAMWLTDFICKYPNITVCIERRSTGGSILDCLLTWLTARGVDPFKRLFNWVVNDYMDYPERYREIAVPFARRNPEVYTKFRELFGFATSGSGAQARHELYGTTLMNAAKHGADRMGDSVLISQVTALTTRNGRIDHASGGHDDMVIAWLLCYWMLSRATNLEFYGIDKGRVLMNAMVEKESEEVVKVNAERIEQAKLRERMKVLAEELAKEPDDIIASRMERELRMLDRQVVLQVGEVHSIDQMIYNATEAKRARRRSQERQASFNKSTRGQLDYSQATIAAMHGSHNYERRSATSYYH